MQLTVNGIDTFVATGGREFDTSLPAIVLAYRQIWRLTPFLPKRTEPSTMATFTPPGCRLRAAYISGRAVVAAVQGGLGDWLMQ